MYKDPGKQRLFQRMWKRDERLRQKNRSTLLVRGLIKKKDVQLLCANCHAIKTYEEDRKRFDHFMGD